MKKEKTKPPINKYCVTCVNYSDGFCDLKGILVEEDDACKKWEEYHAAEA